MEIANNVITMKREGRGHVMYVFYLPKDSAMEISDKSSFTLQNNKITMNVSGSASDTLYLYVWYHKSPSPLTISTSSKYTWASNDISMEGSNVDHLYQYLWYNSPLNISHGSTYTWASNIMSIVGYNIVNVLEQYIWFQHYNSTLTISQSSKYRWLMNKITMNVYKVDNVEPEQHVWFAQSQITIFSLSQFLFVSNTILLLAKDYESIDSYVMKLEDNIIITISQSSSMVWKDNCIKMAHKETDQRHVFGGKWAITDKSEMLWTRNYFTTTEKLSGTGLTEFVWGLQGETEITIDNSMMTMRNTVVNANGATDSIMWSSSLFTYNTNVNSDMDWMFGMKWSSSPAKDWNGSPIPKLDYINLLKYNRCPIPITLTETKTTTPSDSLSFSLTVSPTVSKTLSRSGTSSLSQTPTKSRTMSQSLTPSPTPSSSITISGSVTPTYSINQCSVVSNAPEVSFITVADLFANGVVFEFTVSRPLVSDDGVVEAILWGVENENAVASLIAKCHNTALSSLHDRYTCKVPPPPTSLPTENVSSILLRYMPNPNTSCPLGFAIVVHPQLRLVSNMSGASAPVSTVMANALTDGSVFVIGASSPCAPKESQQGAKVAMHLIAPFSVFGPSAAVFGNIGLTVLLCVVGFAILYLGKHSGWDIITDHPILKVPVGFRATLFGMGFWLAELTYPGVVVGTFGLIRAGDSSNIGLGAVGCVYLVLVPVMAVVVMGPFRSPFVTYKNVNSRSLMPSQCIYSSLFTPHGMWGGTGPALGPVTQPFAGIRKAAVCAPLNYIMMAVVGAVLHTGGSGTSCVARLATVAALLFVVGVAIAVTRPFRYPINNVLYTITFNLLAIYTALLAISASRHDVEHNSQEDRNDIAMGFVQLAIGVSLCLAFLVRSAVFVVLVIKGGSIDRMKKW